MEHNYFSDASFGRSMAFITQDLVSVYHVWNVQFKTHYASNPSSNNASTHENIAQQFGEFMKTEFLKAITAEESRRKKEWDEGEKITEICENGAIMTSLVNESQPEYKSVDGKFSTFLII